MLGHARLNCPDRRYNLPNEDIQLVMDLGLFVMSPQGS